MTFVIVMLLVIVAATVAISIVGEISRWVWPHVNEPIVPERCHHVYRNYPGFGWRCERCDDPMPEDWFYR